MHAEPKTKKNPLRYAKFRLAENSYYIKLGFFLSKRNWLLTAAAQAISSKTKNLLLAKKIACEKLLYSKFSLKFAASE